MIVIIRKRHLAMAAAAVLAVCVLAYLLWQPVKEAHVFAADTVVVDAGHGGADGGAVASDGTAESGINLAITVKVRDAIKVIGQEGGYVYIMDMGSGIPYISTTLSTDVTAQVKAKLGIK